ncbi:MAG: hypothetical protein CL678_16570 [Bdellovibrionaceae bacterium]|nr:hypothetical protein [Pseudobdellovibrionaceae bacterium]|tara:strand:- start:1640 stop:2905 length:1266 start_codon:yes stop_codon:yes gene_type:complete
MSDYPNFKTEELHFLVVEDDPESREMMCEFLEELGAKKITAVTEGGEAIQVLEKDSSIDFIISDWDMPRMTGIELLKTVRQHPKFKNLPFLIATAPISEETEKVLLAAEHMVDSYVVKPFRLKLLSEKINEVLSKSIHGPQKEVVLVDDNPGAREMVSEFLEALGFKKVVVFSEGESALLYLKKAYESVGLIISDWEMPRLSGAGLLKACKNEATLTSIPFLMITSQSSMERVKIISAARSKVDQYLLKPFGLTELKTRIDEVMNQTKFEKEIDAILAESKKLRSSGQLEGGVQILDDLLKKAPSSDEVNLEMARALQQARGVDAALPYFKKALEINPYLIDGYLEFSKAYEQLGFVEKAIALLEMGLSQMSFYPDLHCRLGELYLKKNLVQKAKESWKKALELDPLHEVSKIRLNEILED